MAPTRTMVRQVPWAQLRLEPQRVWGITQGAGQIIAVIDTGVDAAIPQLAGHVLPGFDVLAGHGSADTDCVGHGTFIAGIIAAAPASGTGFVGVAPEARILPIRQSGPDSTGTTDGLARAIRLAVDSGASVINVSVGSQYANSQLNAAVAYAAIHNILIVASVSNDAQSGDALSYPAAYPSVIGVAAIGQDGARADFSQTGGAVSLAAPGSGVLSLGPGGPGELSGSGTSFATAFVSGVAALVRSAYPHLTAQQVRSRLEMTADHPSTALPDPQFGWGVVNPYSAVTDALAEESGDTTREYPVDHVTPPRYPSSDHRPRQVALVVTLASAAVMLLLVFARMATPKSAASTANSTGTGAATPIATRQIPGATR
jgi:type VII secretion-associated serine protease mycosin